MTSLQIINRQGQIVGTVKDGKFKFAIDDLKALFKRWQKRGCPTMMGDSTDEESWDGMETIKADDSRWYNAACQALRWLGYQFVEVPEDGD